MTSWIRLSASIILLASCSSVTIMDVKHSMSRAQVEKLMGPPDFKETSNGEEVWTYTGTKMYGDCKVTFNADRVMLPPYCKDMNHSLLGMSPEERRNQDYIPPPIRNNDKYIPSDRKGGDHLILGAGKKFQDRKAEPDPIAVVAAPPPSASVPLTKPSEPPVPSVPSQPSKASP